MEEAPPIKQQPNIFVAIGCFLCGPLLAYWVLRQNGWSWQGDILEVWRHLAVGARALVVGAFIMSAWGTGGVLRGVLNGILSPRRQG